MKDPVLEAAKANRKKLDEEMNLIVGRAEQEERGLSAPENAKFTDLLAKRAKLDADISEKKAENKRYNKSMAAAAELGNPGKTLYALDGIIRSEPMTYSLYNATNSYIKDMIALQVPAVGWDRRGAAERMGQHAKEVEVEARTDATVAKRLAEAQWELRVNPNTTAGTGGELVPPLYLVAQYIPYARPGRVIANRCKQMPLPPGTDIINIPKLTLGSLTAIQQANAAAVASQDITTSLVAGPVNTVAGQEDVSLQLIEQSPIAMDGVVFEDLTADYDQRLDQQVIYGTGSGGQHLGVLSVAQQTSNTNILKANGVTVSSATFFDGATSGTQTRAVLNGINAVETLRFASPTAIWVHPRRSNSWSYAADSATAGSGRPPTSTPAPGHSTRWATTERRPSPKVWPVRCSACRSSRMRTFR